MSNILSIIEKETSGKSFKSYKYCYDSVPTAGIEYDDSSKVVWKNYGETEKHTNPVSIRYLADKIVNDRSIFTYFLDGSRHTYKIDDITYSKNVFPVLAGQIGIGCWVV